MTEHTQASPPGNPSGGLHEEHRGGFDLKSRLLWTVLFILIAACSIWAIISMNRDFSFADILHFFQIADPIWLIGAVCGMLGFILFEGIALQIICRSFGYKTRFRDGFFYSAADIYVSAITPSATGGQPASAYLMKRDGISGIFSTVALLSNLIMYTLAGILLGLFCLPFHLPLLMDLRLPSILLIVVGLVVQCGLMVFFLLLLFKKNLMRRICDLCLQAMIRLRMVRRAQKWQKKMEKWMTDYAHFSTMMKGKRREMGLLLLFNLLQKISQIMVPVCIYLAGGGDKRLIFDIFTVQTFSILGSTCIPIPGGMGVNDLLLMDGLRALGVENSTSLGLISRALSFYLCVLICGVAFMVKYCLIHRKRR